MKPKSPIQKNSLAFAGALICQLALSMPAFAVDGVWANPTLPSTATLTSNVDPGTEADLVWTGNPFNYGDSVFLTGTVPGGFTPNTTYYVVSDIGDTIQLAAAPFGIPILATTAIADGTARANYQLWQYTGSWAGGIIPTGTDSVATFSNDFTAPETVGVEMTGLTSVGVINFTDTTAPASGLVLTAGTLTFDAASPQVNVTQPAAGAVPLTFAGTGPLTLSVNSINGLTLAVTGSTTPSTFGTGVNWGGFQGPLNFSSGNYQTAAANVLPGSGLSSISLGAGVQIQALQDAARNQSIGGLSGSGTLGTNDNAAAAGTLTLGTGSPDTEIHTYSGVLGGDILTPGLPNSNFNLTKTGASTQILSGANLYTGNTFISGGILKVTNPTALGAVTGGTEANGGTLDLFGNSISVGGEPLILNGIGLNGMGALINSSPTPISIDPTLNNGGRAFSVGGTGDITFGIITGSGGLKLTKVGSNTVTIANSADNAFLTTQADAGVLVLATQPTGNKATDSITITAGGTVRLGSVGGGQQQINNNALLTHDGVLDLNGFSETIGGFASTGITGLVTNGGAAPATFTVGNNNAITTYAGVIADGVSTVGLVKLGTGTQTLSGIHTYTGTTSVTGGTLLVNGSTSAASAVTIAVGGAVGGIGTIGGAVTVNGGITPGNGGVGTITFGSPVAITATAPATSNINLQITNWTGAAGTGFDNISAQSISITADAVNKLVINLDGAGVVNFSETNKTFIIATTTGGVTGLAPDNWVVNPVGIPSGLGASFALAVVGNNLVLQYTAGSPTGDRVWDGGADPDVAWSNVLNWSGLVPAAGDTLTFDGSVGLTNFNNLGSLLFNGVTFAPGAGAFTLQGSEIQLGDTGAVARTIVNNSAFVQTLELNLLTKNDSAVAGARNVINTGAGGITFSGALSGDTGANVIEKAGAGVLTLSGATDNPAISLLPVAGDVMLGKASGAAVHSLPFLNLPAAYAGTFRITGTGDDQISNLVQSTIDGGVLDLNGRNETLLNLRSTAANATVGQAVIKNDAVGLNSILTLNNTANTAFGNKIEASAVVGAGTLSVVKSGGNEVQFNGINTYTGGTTMTGGTIRMGGGPSNSRIGTGTLILANNTNTSANPGAWPKGLYSTAGNYLINNNIIVQAGTFNRSEISATGTHTYSGTLTGSGTLSIAAGFEPTFAFTGDFTGFTGNLILAGNGGTGGYSGNYDLRNTTAVGLPLGTLTLNSGHHSTSAGNNSKLRWNPTTSAATVTIPLGGLVGSFAAGQSQANVLIMNEKAGTVATWQIGALGGNTTYAGIIQNGLGTSALEKVGPGRLTLAGTNTYTGTTTVTAGTLTITGSLAAGSAVTVAAAGKLGGTGTVNGTVGAAGTIAPGTSVGTLTTGAATLSGSLAVEVNATTADLWAVNGTVNLTGASLTVADVAAVPLGAVRTIATYTAGGRTGTLTNLSSNYTVAYDQGPGSNEIRITKVADAGYNAWAMTNGLTFGVNDGGEQDPDFDGIANVLEYVLGSTNPVNQSSTGILPKVSYSATHLILDFKRKDGSINDTTQVIQISTGLGGWSNFVTLGAASAGPVEITDDGPLENIRVSIPLSNQENGKLFARLRAIKP